jgi:hypothetical protein
MCHSKSARCLCYLLEQVQVICRFATPVSTSVYTSRRWTPWKYFYIWRPNLLNLATSPIIKTYHMFDGRIVHKVVWYQAHIRGTAHELGLYSVVFDITSAIQHLFSLLHKKCTPEKISLDPWSLLRIVRDKRRATCTLN